MAGSVAFTVVNAPPGWKRKPRAAESVNGRLEETGLSPRFLMLPAIDCSEGSENKKTARLNRKCPFLCSSRSSRGGEENLEGFERAADHVT